MAVETAKKPEEPPNPNARVRRKPHRCRPTVDAAIEALRSCAGLVGPASARLGMSRSHLNRMIGNSPRLAAAYHDINENAVDRVEAGLFTRASEAKEHQWTAMFLRAKGASRGYGPNGQAGADGGAAGIGIGKVTIMSAPSNFFVMKVNGTDRLLNPAQTDALQSGVTDEAELAALGPEGEPPVGMLPDEGETS
jgi:hypothetical protein